MKSNRENKGAVLILSVIATIILFVVVSQYSFTTKIEFRLAENSRDNLEIYYISRAVKEAASALLLEDKNMLVDCETDLWGSKYEHRPIMMSYTQGLCSNSSVYFMIEDTARFINLAGLWSSNEKIREDTEKLIDNFCRATKIDIECGIIDMGKRISAYVGADNSGAYSDSNNLGRKLLTQDEILDMPGIYLENMYKIFYGYESTRSKWGGVSTETERYLGMKHCTTIWGDNTTYPPRININTAPLEVLQAVILMNNSDISVDTARDEAQIIINKRDEVETNEDGDNVKMYFNSIPKIKENLTDMGCTYAANSHRWFTVMGGPVGKSQFFHVTVFAGKPNFQKEIRIILEKKLGKGGRPEVAMHMWREIPPHVPIKTEEDAK